LKPKRAGLPPSPISDESLTKAGPSTIISPGTAALAGFSQLDAIDFGWEDDDMDDIQEVQAGPSRPTKPPLVQSRSAAMMPPPPVPASRPSVSPATRPPMQERVDDSSPLVPQPRRPRQTRERRRPRVDKETVRNLASLLHPV
jgi:ATP-dependent DNA helicase MPH1